MVGSIAPVGSAGVPAASAAVNTAYAVQKGDSLWKISQNKLNGGRFWALLWQYNNDNGNAISDPNMIKEGQQILLPPQAYLDQHASDNMAAVFAAAASKVGFFNPLPTLPQKAEKIDIAAGVKNQAGEQFKDINQGEMTAAICALAAGESSNRANAINDRTAAFGLFQFLPTSWNLWTKQMQLPANYEASAEHQIEVAMRKLAEYYRKYGNWEDVFAAWYGGEGAVVRKDQTGGYDTAYTKNLPNNEPSIEKYVKDMRARQESFKGPQKQEIET